MYVQQKVRKIFRKAMDVEVEDDDVELSTFQMDSLNTVEILIALENEFGIEISDYEMASAVTVDDVIKLVEGKIGG